ncbi:hypothetical protein GEMRC1_007211 [Eukaryota sp. GEM-RC1]
MDPPLKTSRSSSPPIDSVCQTLLTCTICWRLYKDPVTLKCGDSFCFQCLRNPYRQACPQCNTGTTPKYIRSLSINKNLKALAEHLFIDNTADSSPSPEDDTLSDPHSDTPDREEPPQAFQSTPKSFKANEAQVRFKYYPSKNPADMVKLIFKMNTTAKFSKLAAVALSKLDVLADDCLFFVDNQPLDLNGTPKSLKLGSRFFVECRRQVSGFI